MPEILSTENVVQRFGGLDALKGITMHVNEGEIIGVIGPKRMDYKKVLASLDYFATGLSEELDGHDRSNTET